MEEILKYDDGIYRPYTAEELEERERIIEEMQKQQEQAEENTDMLG